MRVSSLFAMLTSCSLVTSVPDDSAIGDGGSQSAGPTATTTGGGGLGTGAGAGGDVSMGGAGAGGGVSSSGGMSPTGGAPGSGGELIGTLEGVIQALELRAGRVAALTESPGARLCLFDTSGSMNQFCFEVADSSGALALDWDGTAYTAGKMMPTIARWTIDGPTLQAQASTVRELHVDVDAGVLLAASTTVGASVTETPTDLSGSIAPLLDSAAGAIAVDLASDASFYYVIYAAPGYDGMRVFSRETGDVLIESFFSQPLTIRADEMTQNAEVYVRVLEDQGIARTIRTDGLDPSPVCTPMTGQASQLGGLAVGGGRAFMFVNDGSSGLYALAMAYGSGDCVIVATGIKDPGPIATDGQVVFYADDAELYRLALEP